MSEQAKKDVSVVDELEPLVKEYREAVDEMMSIARYIKASNALIDALMVQVAASQEKPEEAGELLGIWSGVDRKKAGEYLVTYLNTLRRGSRAKPKASEPFMTRLERKTVEPKVIERKPIERKRLLGKPIERKRLLDGKRIERKSLLKK